MIYRRPARSGERFVAKPGRASVLCLYLILAALGATVGSQRAARSQTLRVARYGNTVNQHFATVSNGPQSGVVLDLPAGTSDADTRAATLRAARSLFHGHARAMAAQIDRWRRLHVLKTAAPIPVSEVITVRRGGVIVRPTDTRTRAAGNTRAAVGGGTLTFTYSGFDSTDEAFLQQIEASVYPTIVSVYGQPAVSGTVTVVNAGGEGSTLTDKQYLAYGVYDASNNQILLPTYGSNESFVDAFILTMINAFHGPAVFQYDAWEQGFARAAASVVARETATTVGITDPSSNGLFDLLPYYDLCNQPSLGNSTFYPPSQAQLAIDNQTSSATMFVARLGMSGAAWLKVYIENPNFFKQFNTAYYAQFDTSNPSLAGNIPLLLPIAATFLPNGVEGTPWASWYQQQQILDTAYSSGEQLFSFTIPGTYDPTDSTSGQSNSLSLTYFVGQANGDETLPTSATAYATYFDATDATLNLGVAAGEATITAGEGSLTTLTFPTQGVDSGRITVALHCNNASTLTYFPSGFTGDFQGVVLGPNSAGNASVTESTVPSVVVRTGTGALTNAGFGVTLGSQSSDLAVTTVTLDNGGGTPSVYRINTGDGQYYAVIRRGNTGGGVVTATQTFTTSDLPSLITFPVQPLNRIIDQALGLNGSAFVMSYWDATQNVYETLIPGQVSIAPIEMGRGYWFKLEPTSAYTTQTVTVTGIAPSTDTDFTLGLVYGWNLIGSPFASPIDLTDILVQYEDNTSLDFADAVTDSLVAANPFEFDATSTGYDTVSTIDGTNWQGYWLRVYVPDGVILQLPGPDATSRAAVAHRAAVTRAKAASKVPATPAPDWTVHLRASQQTSVVVLGKSAGRISRSSVAFGVGSAVKTSGFDNRYDLEAPPPIVSALTVDFPHKEWADSRSTARYVADYRSSLVSTQGTIWNLEVQTPNAGTVTLAWDGLPSVTGATQLVLVDTATKVRTPLNLRSSYTFTATAGQPRAFQIISELARSVPLTITPLLVTNTRAASVGGSRAASGVNISYMVSGAADVSAQFTALNGRVVRGLATTRAAATVTQSIYWDGKGSSGQVLPTGIYRVEITARADDGTEARFSRLITLLQ